MRNFPDVTSERRRAPRTKLAEIAYLAIGPENGAIVLDVSDGGLSFHAVSPVQPAEAIRFLLSLRGHSRIEGSGEVVWTDDMKTVCGLRFTSLSAGAREHLDNWTNKTRMAAAGINPSEPAAQTESPEFDADLWAADAEPVFAIPPAEEQLSPDPEAGTLWQNPAFYWILSGLLAASLALASFLYGVHVGKSEIGTVARSAPKPASLASPPKIAAASVPAPSVASSAPAFPTTVSSIPKFSTSVPSTAAVSASKSADASGSAVKRPAAEAHRAAVPNQRAEPALEAGKSELAAALAALNGDNGKRDSARAVRLLQAAVSNGNTTAAVLLADLYVTGDGIAENCDQGRILLKAAASKGNAEAKVKLDELNANGCP
jgi:hypothetical protein